MDNFGESLLGFLTAVLSVAGALAGLVLLYSQVGSEAATWAGAGLLAGLAWRSLGRFHAAIGLLALLAWMSLPAGTTRAVVARLVPDLAAPAAERGEAVAGVEP